MEIENIKEIKLNFYSIKFKDGITVEVKAPNIIQAIKRAYDKYFIKKGKL